MNRRGRSLLAVLVVAGSLLLPTTPVTAEAATSQTFRSMDELLAAVARKVPEFGGMYVDDEQGALYVYIKGQSDDAARKAESSLREALEPEHGPLGKLKVLEAQVGFARLKGWYEHMAPDVLPIPGVVLTDMDEAKNRLAVGVENEEAHQRVERRLAQLGVPREAVEIRRVRPEAPDTTLQDRHRPIAGGLQVSFTRGKSAFLCTLGFNAVRNGVSGFVTNSHCTATRGGVEGTVFHQADVVPLRPWAGEDQQGTNRTGVEIVDPAYFDGGACPAQRLCRFSDAAFAQLDSHVTASLGRIARPALGALDWDGGDSFRIVKKAEFSVSGQTLTKVGRSTGRTQGKVTATCQNINVLNTNFTMLCQDRADYARAPGDSGSPVFRITNSPEPHDATLYGIHWSSGGGFSSFGNIGRADEIGPISPISPRDPLPPEPSCGPYPC